MYRKFLFVLSFFGSVFFTLILTTSTTLAQDYHPTKRKAFAPPANGPYQIFLPLVNKVTRMQQPTWEPVNSPTANNLLSISMLSDSLGFAVGKAGSIIKWDGTNWTPVDSPTTVDLTSVSMGNHTNAWALGGNTILMWNGTNWSQISGGPNLPFFAVDAVGEIAWMVGGYMLCNPGCYDITSFISQWDGSAWDTVYSPHKYLYSIDMISSIDGFAVGDIYNPTNPLPAIIRWNGSVWENQNHPSVIGLYDISVYDIDNAWAVGADTNMMCTLLRWNGSTWTDYQCPNGVESISSISMASANDAWAIGGETLPPWEDNGWSSGNTLIHWDGNSWSTVDITIPANLKDIDMISEDNGWIVGANGTVLHFSP